MVQLKYFGDDRDYFKYDLITSIFQARIVSRYVYIPMLTEDGPDRQGEIAPRRREGRSSKLYDFIMGCNEKSLRHWQTWLERYTVSYETVEPADKTYFREASRARYWHGFKDFTHFHETLVFVDPDTGLQTGDASYRRRMGVEKYLLDDELNQLFAWLSPASVLMTYQHLPRDRKRHIPSIDEKLKQVQSVCRNGFACAYREEDLAFLFVTGSRELFQRLFVHLGRYYDESANSHKALRHLHNEPGPSVSRSASCDLAIAKKKERKGPVKRNKDGVIINAEELTVQDVVQQKVLCPACQEKVFEKWPLGWDAHAAFVCPGIPSDTPANRKLCFKERFPQLFR